MRPFQFTPARGLPLGPSSDRSRPVKDSTRPAAAEIFVTGATGYIGSRLIPLLLARGHRVAALARSGSERRVPTGCRLVIGNALDHGSYVDEVPEAATLIHLVGTPHPSPAKAAEFRSVDLAAAREAIAAAVHAGIAHLIYVSVAHPAPVMHAYQEVRVEVEARIRANGLNATILRPWYVLGPGHRWPYLLLPLYALGERLPGTRQQARRLGLVRLPQMLEALVHAVEHPARGVRVVEVPEIRATTAPAARTPVMLSSAGGPR